MVKKEQDKEAYIQTLMENRIIEFLECDPKTIDTEVFNKMMAQSKIGMAYVRDREIMKRVNNGQIIRVINLITSDPRERQRYIMRSMPEIGINALEGTE